MRVRLATYSLDRVDIEMTKIFVRLVDKRYVHKSYRHKKGEGRNQKELIDRCVRLIRNKLVEVSGVIYENNTGCYDDKYLDLWELEVE
jgi:hypothetical protein